MTSLSRTSSPASGLEWREYLLWAYRLMLGREPEPEALDHSPYRDRLAIVRTFVASSEFARINGLGLPSRVEVAKLDGFSIYADREDQLIGSPVYHGLYEPHVTALFRRYLKSGMTVADVGANIGYFALLAASLVGPSGEVIAVEASVENAKLLEASRRLNGFDQVTVVAAAAASHVGLLALNSYFSNSVVAPLGDAEAIWTSTVTPCLPLRSVLPQRRLDFMKIDIEGAEFGAVLGCLEILQRDRPVVVSEFGPGSLLAVSKVDPSAYLQLLISCGLELGVVTPQGQVDWRGSDTDAVMQAFTASGVDHIDVVAAPRSAMAALS